MTGRTIRSSLPGLQIDGASVPMIFARVKLWARQVKTDVLAIYIAGRDPRMPWHVKIVALAIAGYAFSPIDLIPDFIPVLGYLDDLVVVPVGIMLVVKMMPKELMAECRAKALDRSRPSANWIVGALIVAVWLIAIVWLTIHFYPYERMRRSS